MCVRERQREGGGEVVVGKGGRKREKKEKVKDRLESESMVREIILERSTTVAMKLLQEQRQSPYLEATSQT